MNQLTGTTTNPFKGLHHQLGTLNGSNGGAGAIADSVSAIRGAGRAHAGNTSNGVLLQENPAGSSYYESLNVRLQKRLSNSLTLLNNFVWSRLTDRLAYLNDSDPAPEKRVSSDSRPLARRSGSHLQSADRPRPHTQSAKPRGWMVWSAAGDSAAF